MTALDELSMRVSGKTTPMRKAVEQCWAVPRSGSRHSESGTLSTHVRSRAQAGEGKPGGGSACGSVPERKSARSTSARLSSDGASARLGAYGAFGGLPPRVAAGPEAAGAAGDGSRNGAIADDPEGSETTSEGRQDRDGLSALVPAASEICAPLRNRHVVDRRLASPHEARRVEFPLFVPVTAQPVTGLSCHS